MRKATSRKGADAAQLREEFAAAGLAVTVKDPDAQGRVEVEAPDGVPGETVDFVLRRHVPRSLAARARAANSLPEIRAALVEVLELMAER